jgi:hypothetical protein
LGFERGSKVPLRFFYHSDDPRKDGDKGRKLDRLKWEEVERLQSEGRGVYVVVNGHNGGHEDKDISQCIAIFCEWDDMPLEDQVLYWETVGFLEPTFTVYSGDKSMHPYWIFDKPLTDIDQWRELQQLLIEVMNADPANKNPSRVFRLAGGWHIKPGRDPVRSEIVQDSGKKYSPNELLMKLREIKQQQQPEQKPLNFTRYESIQVPVPESIPLKVCLSKESRSLLESGVSEGGRNTNGAKLARDLIGTADYLVSIGQRFDGDVRLLLEDYASRCNPPLPSKEVDAIWKSAQKARPKPSCPTDYIENNIRAWYWREHVKPTGRGYGSGGNRQNIGGGSGGGGGDDGDGGSSGGKVIKHPSFNPISPEELEARLDALIQEGLSGAKLTNRLNHLATETGRHVIELRKQYSERLEEVEREEGREDTHFQVDALIDASRASVNLREVLPCSLAKPLLKLATWLNLKPESYLTALLTTTSILHKAGTKVVLNEEWDFEVSPNLYSAIIAASSQKKSPIIKAICTKPLRALQKEALQEYKDQMEIYGEELKEWEATKPEDRGQPPVKPERKIYFFTKTTGEGLTYQAARCPEQGMLYLTDELAGMLNAQNQYRGGKGSDKQDLLSYYDGSGDVVLRAEGVKSENDFILLGLLGGIQPKIMQKLLDDCSDSDGGWARFMFVNQPNAASRMNSDGGKYDLTELLSNLYRRIDALPPTEYRLSPEAFRLFCKAYNRLEDLRTSDRLEGMQSVWGKSEGRIGKLAVNLHVIHALMKGEIPSEEIPVGIVRTAISLTKFYAQQVQSLYTQFSDPDALAPQLVKIIELSRKNGWLKASDVYLSITKKSRPSGETVREWFGELVVMGKGEVKGQGRSLQFRAFSPNEPPPSPPLDEIRQNLDKSSNAETTIYQEFQDKLDKLDDLDDFLKTTMDDQAIEVRRDSTTGLGKNSVLDKSSNLSNFTQNAQPGGDTALDDLSNKSSKLDAVEIPAVANTLANPIEKCLEAKEQVADDQTSQQRALPIYQQSDGGFAVELYARVAEQPTSVEQKASTSADEAIAIPAPVESALQATEVVKVAHATPNPSPLPQKPNIEVVDGTSGEEAIASSGAEYDELIAKIDTELKRLCWSSQQGKEYIMRTYGKRSRVLMFDHELHDFLRYLESQQIE